MKRLRRIGLGGLLCLLACNPKYYVQTDAEEAPEGMEKLSLHDLEVLRNDYVEDNNLVAVRCIDYLARWVLFPKSTQEILEAEESRSVAAISMTLSPLAYEATGTGINESLIVSKRGEVRRRSDNKRFLCGESRINLSNLPPKIQGYILRNYSKHSFD